MVQGVAGELSNSKILVIEDDLDSLELLEKALRRAGFEGVIAERDPYKACDVFAMSRPDLVILDYHLPPTNAIQVMARCRMSDDPSHPTPMIMLTGSEDESLRRRALEAGVADFLSKSYDHTEVVLRVRNTLQINALLREVRRQKMWLEESVRIRTIELNQARKEVLERLAVTAEFRDYHTGEHTRRVGRLAGVIARAMGSPEEFAQAIETAALLHDIGKIAVPDRILLKPGPLTPDEYDVVKRHPEIGAQILSGCTEPVLAMAHEVALTHHERWDGKGYPRGLAGPEIPLSGRIVALADAYDAMRSDRPYKSALTHEEAAREVIAERGAQFDPDVVAAFLDRSDTVITMFDPLSQHYSWEAVN